MAVPTWAKILFITAAVMMLLVAGCVGAGFYWWSRNRDALVARGKALFEEGQAAGQLTDNKGCLDQAVARYKASPGLTGSVSSGVFIQSCLPNSRPTPGFCDDVPKMTDYLTGGQWQKAKCRSIELATDPMCPSIFQSVQSFCSQRSR